MTVAEDGEWGNMIATHGIAPVNGSKMPVAKFNWLGAIVISLVIIGALAFAMWSDHYDIINYNLF